MDDADDTITVAVAADGGVDGSNWDDGDDDENVSDEDLSNFLLVLLIVVVVVVVIVWGVVGMPVAPLSANKKGVKRS